MVPPMHPQMIPPYTPPQSRSRVGWVLAFIGVGLFVAVVIAVMMIARFGQRFRDNSSQRSGTPVAQAGETALTEANADLVVNSGNDSTLTKTFALGDGAKFSLKNVNGNITVSAWDQPTAEVKVIKRGGSDRNAQVFFTNTGGNLSIRTAQTRGNQDLRFEVKLPRTLGRVDLSSTNGVIKLSDVTAEILVNATNGAIELANVVGASKIRTVNGNIKATLLAASDRPMEFENTNGSIDLTVPPGFEADLDASTVHGGINIDETFAVQVEKGVVGQKAKGEIGQGGERLKLATTNGNIKLGKAEEGAKRSAKGKENGN
jgi:putative adhesin